MKFYLDASFVVSLFINDGHTEKADIWIAKLDGEVIVSDLCALEFAASVSRCVRTGRLSVREAEEALIDFDEWRSRSTLPASAMDLNLAARLVRDFTTKLAAADALHLAGAINISANLVTFDVRLAEAAKGQGVEVAALG